MGRTGKAYRKIRANFTDKPTFFTWVREERLAASGRPFSRQQIDWLRDNGVTAILSLTEEALPSDWTTDMETEHISMKDHAPPSVSDMRLAADYLASALSKGKVVLVHCLAGKGRTGSVLAAYMMAYEGKTARQALDELRSTRGGSVERAQEPMVFEFEAEALKGRSARDPGRGRRPRSPLR
jgi:atypical dual specificity phosphatase